MQSKYEILKARFGHNSFRDKQEEAVDAILEGKDLLMVLPTGGGKSLSFQLPTLMLPGTTIVISPLIALMQDQVQALKAQQINADMLSSSSTAAQNEEVIAHLLQGGLDFLYISPERLNTPRMQQILSKTPINFFVIDEAHCISQWGHEFRNDYRSLSLLKELFPNTNIAAFTATATQNVRLDIINLLKLNAPKVLQGSVYRKNLNITVLQRVQKGHDKLLEFLKARQEENGIIYMSSRKKCEELSAYLRSRGFNAWHYHAGMDSHERDRVFKDFVYDRVNIVVATIAFGMGIDKSDIRFVVHMSMPKTIENYYQEIGRAGRDSENADVMLLYSGEDLVYAKMQLEAIEDETYKRHMHEKLATMYRYVSNEECRHQFIASYFEDKMKPCQSACDNCQAGEVEKVDITQEAKKALSAIYRTNQRFGKGYIIDILRGSSNQKIIQNSHDKLSVYGIGKERSKKQWLVIIDRLLETENLGLGEYHVLVLTPLSAQILKGKASLKIANTRLDTKTKIKKAEVIEDLHEYDVKLFERLRKLRADTALELGVPAYIVFGDKTLKEMAKKKPCNEEEMLEVNGVGKKKFEQFGKAFLSEIGAF